MSFLDSYRAHLAECAALGVAPTPLSARQTSALISLLHEPPQGEEEFLLSLLTQMTPITDDAVAVCLKAGFLDAIAKGREKNPLVSRDMANELLGALFSAAIRPPPR